MSITVTWFRHNHDGRNDLLRFGLMELYYSDQIKYIEKPFHDALRDGFSRSITNYQDLRHKSFLLIEEGKNKVKCLVDLEDSFILFSPLLTEVDIYFCGGYNSDVFEKKQFITPYQWQDNIDLQWYHQCLEKKISQFGNHFSKVKRYVPIGPNIYHSINLSPTTRKLKNAEHKLNRLLKRGDNFKDIYKGFKIRYNQILNLRNNRLNYDISLNDSLWGWPQHRINLHEKLVTLSLEKNYKIHSSLKWCEPVLEDGSLIKRVDPNRLPIMTKAMPEDYETMLSKSRLGVFACGFHWGWRNIMILALMVGIPVLTDRLLTEAYFDLNEFDFYQQEDHHWESIEKTLNSIDESKWEAIKKHNQSVYDQRMAPIAVANYFIKTSLS